MKANKTIPTNASVNLFIESLTEKRRIEARSLVLMLEDLTGEKPVMWGPSIVGFGGRHYKYETGREGDVPKISFSPRKASISIYFMEGFENYADELIRLGKYKNSVSCLYINKLEDVDIDVLNTMLEKSFNKYDLDSKLDIKTVDDYVRNIPNDSRQKFDELRSIVKEQLPMAMEVLSYGIIGYKIDEKRARVFVSGWKDHVAMYPIPKNIELRDKLKPYIKGKGTLWFDLSKPLPVELIRQTVKYLVL